MSDPARSRAEQEFLHEMDEMAGEVAAEAGRVPELPAELQARRAAALASVNRLAAGFVVLFFLVVIPATLLFGFVAQIICWEGCEGAQNGVFVLFFLAIPGGYLIAMIGRLHALRRRVEAEPAAASPVSRGDYWGTLVLAAMIVVLSVPVLGAMLASVP